MQRVKQMDESGDAVNTREVEVRFQVSVNSSMLANVSLKSSRTPLSVVVVVHLGRYRFNRPDIKSRYQTWKLMLSIYQLICVPALGAGHKLCVLTKRLRTQI